ncbi:DUF6600 domain-containing protein [Pedobacter namyangjuensis]|uniref:DUF6600 domain-containing protein n=1 Tax=Pedobacter namyangjuensis TaxID=600626 RepID=UPI000DE1CEA7|nr:DUF6600 domain-containing protein [Pedobacter namyangjuensis]
MKTMIKLPAVLLGLMLLLAGTTEKAMAQQEDVSLQSFYDELSPYGQWIQDPQYGYVWRPDVDQEEFRPYYTNGRWAMTEYGNTWVSNYDWGWAPFHYGRWIYNRYNNWVWLPDTVWGPAWVTWRSGGGHYGWAPLGPSINIGINIGRGGYRIPDMCWNFVPYNNIYYSNYPRYYGNRNRVYIQNTVIINNTYVRNNRTYYTGPRADDIRSRTNQNVTVYNVNRSNRAGASRIDNNSVNIYSPRPSRGESNANAAPRNAVQANINRGPISRDRNAVAGNRTERGNAVGNNRVGRDNNVGVRPERGNGNPTVGNERGGTDRTNGGFATRPTRGENGVSAPVNRDNRVGVTPNNDGVNRSRGFDRRIENNGNANERVERNNSTQAQPQRIERQQQAQQQRMERQQQAQPQRMERPQQQAPQRVERVERQQQVPQRVERSQPQRVERSQSSGGGGRESSGRGNSGGGSSRPGRG